MILKIVEGYCPKIESNNSIVINYKMYHPVGRKSPFPLKSGMSCQTYHDEGCSHAENCPIYDNAP